MTRRRTESRGLLRVFGSAINGEDGEVDVGYLALAWGLLGWMVSCLVVLLIGGFSAWNLPKDAAGILSAMGTSVGYISGGFATMLGAVGFFRYGDKPRAAAAGTTTTLETSKTVVVPAAPPLATPANPIPVAIVDDDPVRVREVPHDKPTKGKK